MFNVCVNAPFLGKRIFAVQSSENDQSWQIYKASAESDRGWEHSNKHQLLAVSTSLKLMMNWNVTDAKLDEPAWKVTFGFWAWLGLTGPYWALLGPTGPYWAIIGFTGPYKALQGPTRLDWALLGLILHLLTDSLTNGHYELYVIGLLLQPKIWDVWFFILLLFSV